MLGTGNQAVTVGGRSAYAFDGFEGEMPHPPKVAMEVVGQGFSEDWCEAAKAPFADVSAAVPPSPARIALTAAIVAGIFALVGAILIRWLPEPTSEVLIEKE